MPAELRLADDVDRFGAISLLGRPLTAIEVRTIKIADNIRYLYNERERAESFAEWIRDYPDQEKILKEAAEYYGES